LTTPPDLHKRLPLHIALFALTLDLHTSPTSTTVIMADYSQLKVPDLKKLLQERGLVISGNKADLIARLQEADKKSTTGGGEDH